eukprot:3554213-Pyramimonas_sp.AAC.1
MVRPCRHCCPHSFCVVAKLYSFLCDFIFIALLLARFSLRARHTLGHVLRTILLVRRLVASRCNIRRTAVLAFRPSTHTGRRAATYSLLCIVTWMRLRGSLRYIPPIHSSSPTLPVFVCPAGSPIVLKVPCWGPPSTLEEAPCHRQYQRQRQLWVVANNPLLSLSLSLLIDSLSLFIDSLFVALLRFFLMLLSLRPAGGRFTNSLRPGLQSEAEAAEEPFARRRNAGSN